MRDRLDLKKVLNKIEQVISELPDYQNLYFFSQAPNFLDTIDTFINNCNLLLKEIKENNYNLHIEYSSKIASLSFDMLKTFIDKTSLISSKTFEVIEKIELLEVNDRLKVELLSYKSDWEIRYDLDEICWYCRKQERNKDTDKRIKIYKTIGFKYRLTIFNKANIKIPRCTKCKKLHLIKNILIYPLALLFTIFFELILYNILFLFETSEPVSFLFYFFLGVGSFIISLFVIEKILLKHFFKGIKTERNIKGFYKYDQARLNGWRIGNQPIFF
jgi:hypothetical protein